MDLTERLHAIRDSLGQDVLASRKTGETFVACMYEDSPDKQVVRLLLNRYEASRDPVERSELEQRIRDEQARIHAESGPNGVSWDVGILDANIEAALGTLGSTLDSDLWTLEAATEDWHLVVSCTNVSDTLRRLGRTAEAIDYALRSLELDRRYSPALTALLLALLKDGAFEQAGAILDAYPRALLCREGNMLRNHLQVEPEFREFRDRVPALVECMELVEGSAR